MASGLASLEPARVRRTPSGQEAFAASAAVDLKLAELGLDEDAEPSTAEDGELPREPSSPALEPPSQQPDFPNNVAPPVLPPPNATTQREAVLKKLAEDFRKAGGELMRPSNPLFMHGWAYEGPLATPKVLWASSKKPREDHDAPDWLTATEFADTPVAMDAKVQQLARLLQLSRHTCVYSGAGISASAVGQAARSGTNKVGWLSKTEAQPTLTHRALGALGKLGMIHGWVQQNHDGLVCAHGSVAHRTSHLPPTFLSRSMPAIGCAQ